MQMNKGWVSYGGENQLIISHKLDQTDVDNVINLLQHKLVKHMWMSACIISLENLSRIFNAIASLDALTIDKCTLSKEAVEMLAQLFERNIPLDRFFCTPDHFMVNDSLYLAMSNSKTRVRQLAIHNNPLLWTTNIGNDLTKLRVVGVIDVHSAKLVRDWLATNSTLVFFTSRMW